MGTSTPGVASPDQALAGLRRRLDAGGSPLTRWMLGIAGPPGAGKSTLADHVVASVPGAVLVAMDGFHLAQRVIDAAGLADRKGSPETFDRAGYCALLRRLREQDAGEGVVYAPLFDRRIEEPIGAAVAVEAGAPLVVTEGNYLLHWPEVRHLLDEVWWVDLDPAERVRRLAVRHEQFGKPPEAARAWATGPDARNAALVAGGRGLADLVVALD